MYKLDIDMALYFVKPMSEHGKGNGWDDKIDGAGLAGNGNIKKSLNPFSNRLTPKNVSLWSRHKS